MATIPTPEQGKPILDFSAGTFDGNSNLFQSRNGATEHINGDDVADYVNTSRIYNGLETELKTPVGAINEINAKGVGDIKDVNLSSPADGDVLAYDGTNWVNFDLGTFASSSTASGNPVTCANSTYTECVNLTLNKGLYLFIGMLAFESNTAGIRGINISTAGGDSGIAATRLFVNACVSGQTRFQVVNVIVVNNDSSVYHLNAYQTSGAALDVGYSRLLAVKIGL